MQAPRTRWNADVHGTGASTREGKPPKAVRSEGGRGVGSAVPDSIAEGVWGIRPSGTEGVGAGPARPRRRAMRGAGGQPLAAMKSVPDTFLIALLSGK